ncbi:MAG: beta-propeller fold lactonase family protein [Terracidiphilus sp.]|jgi:6-phosphogluconolactonase (cycloisomerase 2 family)
MKFSKLSQLLLVSAIGLIVATLLTSCEIVTIDYVFVASSTSVGGNGQIQTYDTDSKSGALRFGQPAVPSGGTQPVAMAIDSVYQNLYVANLGNSSVVHFTVAGNGILKQADSITTSSNPVALGVNSAGTYLYVVSGPNPSVLTAYSLTNGTIGSQVSQQTLSLAAVSDAYANDLLVPTGISVLVNTSAITGNAVFVSAYDQSAYNPGGTTSSTANPGWVFGFTIGSGGTLSPSPNSPYKAGIKPVAIAGTPTNEYVYVVDYASSQLIGYSVRDGDSLVFLINGPFRTGSLPTAIALDPRGKYIYVTDSISTSSGGGAVSTFVIDLATGTPSSLASTNNGTDTDPVAITVDAGVGTFVYTANNQGNSISGFDLSVDSGELTPTQASPYPSGSQPTAVVTAPAGSHAVETITP